MKRPIIFLAGMTLLGVLIYEKVIKDGYLFSLILTWIVYGFIKRKTRLLLGIGFLLLSMGNAHLISSPSRLAGRNFNKTTITIEDRKAFDKSFQYIANVDLPDSKSFRAVYYDKKYYDLGQVLKADVACGLVDSRANFSTFNYRNYLKSRRVFLTIKSGSIEILSERNQLLTFRQKARKYIEKNIEKGLSKKSSLFAKSLVLGDKSIGKEEFDDFSKLGISHILAISGLHLSVIIGLLDRIGIYFFKDRKLYSMLVISILGAYGYVIGFPISLIRTLLMYSLKRTYIETRQVGDSLTQLGMSFLIILLINPYYIYNPGLWFSYSAVFGINYIFPRLISNFKEVRGVGKILLASLSIQLSLLPFQLYYTGSIHLLSILVNLLVVPITGILVTLSFTSFILGSFLHIFLAYLLDGATQYVLKVVEYFSSFNTFNLDYPQFMPLYIPVYYFILLACLNLNRIKPSKREKVYDYMVYTLCLVLSINAFKLGLVTARINFIDCGQADAILLRSMGTSSMIDLGGNIMRAEKSGKDLYEYLKKNGVNKLDCVFLSHEDYDHMGNIYTLHKLIAIDRLYIGREYKKNLPIKADLVSKGDNFTLGNINLFVVYDGKEDKKSNDSSMVIRARIGEKDLLFMGDQEKNEMAVADRRAEILKVSHHGSKNASSLDFLQAVAPQYAIISAGKNNRYGHPSKETLARLDHLKILYLTTIDQGNIEIVFIGKSYYIKTYYRKYSLKELFLLLI